MSASIYHAPPTLPIMPLTDAEVSAEDATKVTEESAAPEQAAKAKPATPQRTVQQLNTLVAQIHSQDAEALLIAESLQANDTESEEIEESDEASTLEDDEEVKNDRQFRRLKKMLTNAQKGRAETRRALNEQWPQSTVQDHLLRKQVNEVGANLTQSTPESQDEPTDIGANSAPPPIGALSRGPWDHLIDAIDNAEGKLTEPEKLAKDYADAYEALMKLQELLGRVHVTGGGDGKHHQLLGADMRAIETLLDEILNDYGSTGVDLDPIRNIKNSLNQWGRNGNNYIILNQQFPVWKTGIDSQIQTFQTKMEKAGQDYMQAFNRFENFHKTISSIIQSEADMMKQFLHF